MFATTAAVAAITTTTIKSTIITTNQQSWMKESRAVPYNVKVFLSYCCQTLKAFIHIDLKLTVSSKYN